MKNTTDMQALRDGSGNLFDKKAIQKQANALLAWEKLNMVVLYHPVPMTEQEIEEYCGMRRTHVYRLIDGIKDKGGTRLV